MDTPLLRLESVCYAYEDQPDALRELSVSIYEGERIAVIGNNGAGKSTFFLCCNGVLLPQKGSVYLRGQRIHPKKKELNLLRQHVGIVFQDPNQQLVGATVEEEVSFGPMNLRLAPGEVQARVEGALERMNLEALRERPPHYLSGGEKKRLSIADVLAMHPDLILLDEPTAFLDCANTGVLERILEDLHDQGKTLVVSTHDIEFAYRWATRILVFHDGCIQCDDVPQKVFENSELLDRAGLTTPIVYELAALLKSRGLLRDPSCFPRTVQELNAALG